MSNTNFHHESLIDTPSSEIGLSEFHLFSSCNKIIPAQLNCILILLLFLAYYNIVQYSDSRTV